MVDIDEDSEMQNEVSQFAKSVIGRRLKRLVQAGHSLFWVQSKMQGGY